MTFHDENEIDWDHFSDLTADYSLQHIVSLFDGVRSLAEVLDLVPKTLKEFGLEILIFLLR
jgi:hypothetical protein